jgi:hypothetical protein
MNPPATAVQAAISKRVPAKGISDDIIQRGSKILEDPRQLFLTIFD